MNPIDLIKEILATYKKHGWRLRRVLLRPETRAGLSDENWAGDASIEAAELDALWFSRGSQQNREAWELRLISATQYALFETFEADEPEAAREEIRREMEARMKDKIKSSIWCLRKIFLFPSPPNPPTKAPTHLPFLSSPSKALALGV